MNGFEIEDGQIVIRNGSRVVATTEGTLVNLLPSAYDYTNTINVVFPDFTKDYAYNWQWINDYNASGDPEVAMDNFCSTQQTIPAQSFSDTTTLATAPSGADIFVAMVRLTRTASPSHSWAGSAITPLPPTGVWLPFSGSVLVEAEIGMARAFSLYIADGTTAAPGTPGALTLHRQQSVGTPPGGWGSYGNPGFNWIVPVDGNGGEWVYGSAPGIPVVTIDAQNSDSTIYPVDFMSPQFKTNHRRGGANACSTSLSTNFGSTYSVEIVGKFGRRS